MARIKKPSWSFLSEGDAKPECAYGYTADQIKALFDGHDDAFWKWMQDQTMTMCEGNCGKKHKPSLAIVYEHDLRRFLLGLPVID